MEPPQPSQPMGCSLGEYYAFNGVEISASGQTLAAPMTRAYAGDCTREAFVASNLINVSGESQALGVVRLSPDGRTGFSFHSGPNTPLQLTSLDLVSGTQTPIPLPDGPSRSGMPSLPVGRVVANEGTVIFAAGPQLVLARPGSPLRLIETPYPLTVIIDALATKVVYTTAATETRSSQLRALDLASGQDLLLIDEPVGAFSMSDDGQHVLLVHAGYLEIIRSDGTGRRVLAGGAGSFETAILAGNGAIAYAVTEDGRLLRIDVPAGAWNEVIPRTTYVAPSAGPVDAGMVATLSGAGLSFEALRAGPALPPWLGNVTVRLGDQPLPLYEVGPRTVRFLLPWDLPTTHARVTVQTANTDSPFDFPESTVALFQQPRAGAIARQNWDGFTNVGPVNLGEIIHVWAVGLGPVSPEPAPGTSAPSAEPLARLTDPLVCPEADVLYAGLAPGYVERVYQVDLRLIATGYRQFLCTSGGKPSLALTLYVVP